MYKLIARKQYLYGPYYTRLPEALIELYENIHKRYKVHRKKNLKYLYTCDRGEILKNFIGLIRFNNHFNDIAFIVFVYMKMDFTNLESSYEHMIVDQLKQTINFIDLQYDCDVNYDEVNSLCKKIVPNRYGKFLVVILVKQYLYIKESVESRAYCVEF